MMKRTKKNELNAKIGVLLWFIIHATLIVLGVSVPWKLDSDLYSILPDSSEIQNVSEAEKALSSRSMRNITVLVGHANFDVARGAAVSLDSIFKGDTSFVETRLLVDENTLDETKNFLFDHRYTIQGEAVREALNSKNLEALKMGALQKIYGSFSLANLNRLDEDPFLLGESSFDNYMQKSPMASTHFSLRNGVLAAQDSGVTYVMWNAVLSDKVSSMATDGHVIGRLNEKLDSLESAIAGLRVAASGVPFHSYESSKEAKSEIALISGVSIFLILLLLLYVYRSTLPIVATITTIALAIFTSLAFTWFIFGNVHVFTFVFGTSVIGVSIDYAVHFFTSLKSGYRNVRSKIFKGLVLGFMTTEFSYIALTFADFSLLRQMAVFSMVGLLSSFLTITLLFHALIENRQNAGKSSEKKGEKNTIALPSRKLPMAFPKKFIKFYAGLPVWFVRVLLVIFVIALLPGLRSLYVHTDLGSLYSMSDKLKAGEALNRKLNNIGISSNYFIVEGNSEEDVLEREEELTSRLLQAEKNNLLKSHLAASSFVPSLKTQQQTFEDACKLLLTQDSIVDSSSVLKSSVRDYLAEISIQNDSLLVASLKEKPNYVGFETLFSGSEQKLKLPQSFRSLLEMLWIGAVGDSLGKKFYSAVFPLHVTESFDAQKIAKNLPQVYAVNKIENINSSLTKISRVSLVLVGIAYVAVFLVLIVVYKFKVALKIVRAPVLAGFFVASVFGYLGINFNFFAIVGVILTLGIGIDYALFFREGGRKNQTTALAVILSTATTLISFGSLVYSVFIPVSTFGLAVLLGISCCFLLSPLSAER
ncbi:MMPL family transporter [Fibrobacter sp.]|uniref:MMPL family transporter n=1 Tax=Fibrobacter sp. TaxID=35828 RepID=UPI0025C2987F|nr:MMPL family transporter [Fibrobacter sp.]